jgi:PAS domain S-box-containing protein
MNELASHLAYLRDPRIATLATAATPAWLWSTDATRILWANPAGAAIFGASPADVAAQHFDPRDQVAAQIERLLGTLRLGAAARLERLRGFGTWRALTCSCLRITLADHTAGVLLAAMESASPALTLTERIRRLYDGSGLAVAAFAPDGNLIHATPEAGARLGGAHTLAALGAGQLGADAVAHGRAEGDIALGRVTVERLGTGATMALMATLPPEVATATEPPVPAVANAPSSVPEQPPHEVIAPPTVPAAPIIPEVPPVAPESPDPAVDQAPTPPLSDPLATPETTTEAPPSAAAEAPPNTAARTPITLAEGPPTHAPTPETDTPVAERRHPLRFVWQMDAHQRFTLGSDEFTEVIGPRVAGALGRSWQEINKELALDPENQVGRAVATHDTWSGITVSWPVDGSAERLKVELSGLPIYDRNRNFLGYRGFGVCRDMDRIATLAMMRRSAQVAAQAANQAAHQAAHQPAGQAPTHTTDQVTALATPPASPVATPPGATSAVEARPTLTLVPTARNVVPFRSAAPTPEAKSPGLSPVERNAFHELARQLTARLKGDATHEAGTAASEQRDAPAPGAGAVPAEKAPATPAEAPPVAHTGPAHTEPAHAEAAHAASPAATEGIVEPPASAAATAAVAMSEPVRQEPTERPLLDRLPLGVMVYRLDTLLYANRAFLAWTGYEHLDALAEAGGLDGLFVESGAEHEGQSADSGKTLTIAAPNGEQRPVEARLFSIPWEGETALALMLASSGQDERIKTAETALQTTATSLAAREDALRTTQAELEASETALRAARTTLQATEASLRLAEAQARELKTVLDTATDGVVVIDPAGRIAAANRGAEALFGHAAAALAAGAFTDLFAPASRAAALDYLEGVTRGDAAGLIQDGRELTGEVRQGGTVPLFMTLGRIADDSQRICAVFRDLTPWKQAERDLVSARDAAEKASAAKSDFLAKVSHEIRTPLNSIIGFSEVMLEERFGPIGNERYRDYLKDIRVSGDHVVSLINDLLDLAKIEAGKLDLVFADLSLNEMVQAAVTQMQPLANRERIIIRTSLAPALRPVVADARAVRQIALNLLSNSIKFTGAGGQVIVSTAQADNGDVLLRVRDTGIGMDEKELNVALEPFRQLSTAARWGSGGTGLGLPLTKALTEANRARFTITSKLNDGTLVEVAFPATHVHAE